jgi:hypothetical protein
MVLGSGLLKQRRVLQVKPVVRCNLLLKTVVVIILTFPFLITSPSLSSPPHTKSGRQKTKNQSPKKPNSKTVEKVELKKIVSSRAPKVINETTVYKPILRDWKILKSVPIEFCNGKKNWWDKDPDVNDVFDPAMEYLKKVKFSPLVARDALILFLLDKKLAANVTGVGIGQNKKKKSLKTLIIMLQSQKEAGFAVENACGYSVEKMSFSKPSPLPDNLSSPELSSQGSKKRFALKAINYSMTKIPVHLLLTIPKFGNFMLVSGSKFRNSNGDLLGSTRVFAANGNFRKIFGTWRVGNIISDHSFSNSSVKVDQALVSIYSHGNSRIFNYISKTIPKLTNLDSIKRGFRNWKIGQKGKQNRFNFSLRVSRIKTIGESPLAGLSILQFKGKAPKSGSLLFFKKRGNSKKSNHYSWIKGVLTPDLKRVKGTWLLVQDMYPSIEFKKIKNPRSPPFPSSGVCDPRIPLPNWSDPDPRGIYNSRGIKSKKLKSKSDEKLLYKTLFAARDRLAACLYTRNSAILSNLGKPQKFNRKCVAIYNSNISNLKIARAKMAQCLVKRKTTISQNRKTATLSDRTFFAVGIEKFNKKYFRLVVFCGMNQNCQNLKGVIRSIYSWPVRYREVPVKHQKDKVVSHKGLRLKYYRMAETFTLGGIFKFNGVYRGLTCGHAQPLKSRGGIFDLSGHKLGLTIFNELRTDNHREISWSLKTAVVRDVALIDISTSFMTSSQQARKTLKATNKLKLSKKYAGLTELGKKVYLHKGRIGIIRTVGVKLIRSPINTRYKMPRGGYIMAEPRGEKYQITGIHDAGDSGGGYIMFSRGYGKKRIFIGIASVKYGSLSLISVVRKSDLTR